MNTLKELKQQYEVLKNSLDLNLICLIKLLEFEDLSFSNKEIDKIQDFYLENFQQPEKLKISNDALRKYFFSYCCIGFIRSNGGSLILDENKRSVSFGKPIIVNYGDQGYHWVGISIDAWIKRLEEGQFKGKLSEAINRNLINQTK